MAYDEWMAYDERMTYDGRVACDGRMIYAGQMVYDGFVAYGERMISATRSYYKKTKAILVYFIKNAFNMKQFMI